MHYRTQILLRRLFFAASLLILAVMGYVMHVPLRAPVQSIVQLGIPHFDKIVHFSLYFALSIAVCGWMWVGRVPMLKQVAIVLVLMLGYSAVEEWSQQLSPGRTSDFYDWLADVSGFTLGCVVMWTIIQFGPRTLRATEQPAA
jgi:VanZ family protein